MLEEYSYPHDEIIGAGLYFKQKINEGVDPSECALLVPRNYQVRTAIQVLSDIGVPVSSGKNLSLFTVQIYASQSFAKLQNVPGTVPVEGVYIQPYSCKLQPIEASFYALPSFAQMKNNN